VSRLIDHSGGFWFEVIKRRKSGDMALVHRFMPDETLLRIIGEEAISSAKASVKHKLIATARRGKFMVHRFPNGKYKYGISTRTTSDGKEWPELKDSTIRHRQWKGINRGKVFALRETSQHIYQGLHIKRIIMGRTKRTIEIGWRGKDEKLAMLHEQGFRTSTPWFGKPAKSAYIVPARKIRGFSRELLENLKQLFIGSTK